MAGTKPFGPRSLLCDIVYIYCPGPATVPDTAEKELFPLPDGPAEDGFPEFALVGVVDVLPG